MYFCCSSCIQADFNGWFVISLIMILPIFVSLVGMTISFESEKIVAATRFIYACIISFAICIACVVMGCKFPYLMKPSKNANIDVRVNEAQMKDAIKEVFRKMSTKEKYDLIAN